MIFWLCDVKERCLFLLFNGCYTVSFLVDCEEKVVIVAGDKEGAICTGRIREIELR